MLINYSAEKILLECAKYRAKSPCYFKTKDGEKGCIKGLDTPLTEKLRTISECYDCHKQWYLKGKK